MIPLVIVNKFVEGGAPAEIAVTRNAEAVADEADYE